MSVVKCPKCNTEMSQISYQPINDPSLTMRGGFYKLMGIGIGAIVKYKCYSCNHIETKTEHYNS